MTYIHEIKVGNRLIRVDDWNGVDEGLYVLFNTDDYRYDIYYNGDFIVPNLYKDV